jgi:hypothetical protein
MDSNRKNQIDSIAKTPNDKAYQFSPLFKGELPLGLLCGGEGVLIAFV